MTANMVLYAAAGAVLVLIVAALFVLRLRTAGNIDRSIHLTGEIDRARLATMTSRLEHIDLWGKILTVITVLYALVVTAVFLYVNFTRMP